ncbi:MAG: NTP transferase domain-containing protein [Candidatus Lokiarchaeota archaeon]|nr:NTP transferase domain-containing protein [Candidatus Lokiarchaeota archaeon]
MILLSEVLTIRAIILAAGRGKRLNPITENIPKPLIRICGISLIEQLITSCLNAGVNKITVGLGYKGKQIQEAVTELKISEKVEFIEVSNYRNGPLQTLVSSLGKTKEHRVLVVPSDLVVTSDIVRSFLECASSEMSSSALLGVLSSTHKPQIHLDDSGYILGIGKDVESASKSLSSAMLLSLKRDLFPSFTTALRKGYSHVSQALNHFISQGAKVKSTPVDGLCFDIDTHSALLRGSKYFLESHIQGTASILIPIGDTMELGDTLQLHNGIALHQGVSFHGPVCVDKDCIIEEGCKIGPYVSLGAKTSVKRNSVLRNVLTTGDTEVAANSHIQDAVVHKNHILRG